MLSLVVSCEREVTSHERSEQVWLEWAGVSKDPWIVLARVAQELEIFSRKMLIQLHARVCT